MGYLDSLAQGLRLGGGVLNPQVQEFNQRDEMAATNALRQRQQFMLAQAIRAAETGAADPAKVQQYLAQQGMNMPEGFIGPDQATKQRTEEMRRDMAFRSEFDPTADVKTQLGVAMKHGKPDIAARIAQHAQQMSAQERQRLDALDVKREQIENQYQLGLRGLEDKKATADQMDAFRRSHDEQVATLQRERTASEERWRRFAIENRQQPAPSLTEIVDPAKPDQMIRIDTRQYRGGSVGSPGVIGVSGKEPMAAKREETRGTGREQVDTMIAQLKDSYEQLSKAGGITSTTSDPVSNAMAFVSSSGPGQAVGKTFGTQNQSLRNQIMQSRPLLLAAIKNATGMSARQMDSNVELKLYLSAATDPTLDIQANIAALEQLDRLFGSGAKPAAAKPSGAKPKPGIKPPPGFVED